MTKLVRTIIPAVVFVALSLVSHGPAVAKDLPTLQSQGQCVCSSTPQNAKDIDLGNGQSCLIKVGKCYAKAVNVRAGGELAFDDANIEFWATSIIVENGGKVSAGTPTEPIGTKDIRNTVKIVLYGAPQGTGGVGALCKTDERCGIPLDIWNSNVIDPANHTLVNPTLPATDLKSAQRVSDCKKRDASGNKTATACDGIDTYLSPKDDYFYPYHPLFHDEGDHAAYFGYKVLGVGYGGSLQLYGKKGAIYPGIPADATCKPGEASSTGRAWVRLAATAKAGDPTITVEKPACGLGWLARVDRTKPGDQIVITTTDYLPGHSEQREITAITEGTNTATITLDKPLTYHHFGEKYTIPSGAVDKLKLSFSSAETRAAVGLLSRNIQIVSGGCAAGEALPAPGQKCATPGADGGQYDAFLGGHTVFRQGFKSIQLQGVEFFQMGQGGRLGHYPAHFHHARRTPAETYIMDSSIWDSMTRWVVLHGTHDVTLARNVGYLSIGHGYYLEDGTEINNKLLANLGVFARAAVQNTQNPRQVPGILAAPDLHLTGVAEQLPFKSDYDHPTVFWIMNGWNDFQYNMAAGAATCGVCYWLVPGYNSTISRDLKWESYASMQSSLGRAAMTPLKSFIGNSCTAAMTSFQTVGATTSCQGVNETLDPNTKTPVIQPVLNNLAAKFEDPKGTPNPKRLDYYPSVDTGGGRFATQCGGANADPHADCRTLPDRCSNGNPDACMVTVLDRYTTAFNYAPFNFAAIWLRPQWNLVTDSVIHDTQNAGLTIVTGGGYTASDAPPGHWAIVRRSVFIGKTQPETLVAPFPSLPDKKYLYPDNRYATDGGPFNPLSGDVQCALSTQAGHARPGNRCTVVDEGISWVVDNFGFYQRLFSVYDGPAYQESNAYLNIKSRTIDDCAPFNDDGAKVGRCDPRDQSQSNTSKWLAGPVAGLPKAKDSTCFMPNAAIGWKQPNGFYYPPAFHSRNLYFDNVDVRHFVITPQFKEGTLEIDYLGTNGVGGVKSNTCVFTGTGSHTYVSFAGNDRQTVLNDNDGTLTGYKGTTVINLDPFFEAPVQAVQCQSDNSSRTSPYSYVTTVIYPKCRADGTCAKVDANGDPIINDGDWNRSCTDPSCYGIPLFRQDDLPVHDKGIAKSLRMMGQATSQRASLTVNGGTYYFDTSVDAATQGNCDRSAGYANCPINLFKAGATYYLFNIYAKADADPLKATSQTFQFYVGPTGSNPPDHPFDWATARNNGFALKLLQANLAADPPSYSNIQDFPRERVSWKDKAKGIVQVVLKVSDVIAGADAKANAKKVREEKCKPKTYCTWDPNGHEGTGACNDVFPTGEKDDTNQPIADAICRWAIVEPFDCPNGGCVGFLFTLPGSFETIADRKLDPRPPAACVNQDGSPFNIDLDTLKVQSGECPHDSDKILPVDFCPKP